MGQGHARQLTFFGRPNIRISVHGQVPPYLYLAVEDCAANGTSIQRTVREGDEIQKYRSLGDMKPALLCGDLRERRAKEAISVNTPIYTSPGAHTLETAGF